MKSPCDQGRHILVTTLKNRKILGGVKELQLDQSHQNLLCICLWYEVGLYVHSGLGHSLQLTDAYGFHFL